VGGARTGDWKIWLKDMIGSGWLYNRLMRNTGSSHLDFFRRFGFFSSD